MNPILKTNFTLHSLNESTYELEIQFSNKNECLSKNTFVFVEDAEKKTKKTVDVLTKNGTCGSTEALFHKKDLDQLKKTKKLLDEDPAYDQVVAVLDLKDPDQNYLTKEESIATCEKSVIEFLQKKETSEKTASVALRKFFQETLPLDFLICEGSLKQDLLQKGGFSEKVIEYLNGENGAVAFCQCAEFFMNGFKFGASVKEFHAEKYVKPVSKKELLPSETSCVFYPHSYKKIYSPNGAFAETLRSIFAVTGEYDDTSKITIWNVTKKV